MDIKKDNGPCQVTRAELRDDALRHYEELSDKCCEWSSVVPKAIKYYFDHGDSAIEELVQFVNEQKAWAKRHVEYSSDVFSASIVAFDAVLSKIHAMQMSAEDIVSEIVAASKMESSDGI